MPVPKLLCVLHFFLNIIMPFDDIKRAAEDLSQVKALVKKFSAQRAMCLMIFCALFRVKAHQNRTNSAPVYLGAILFTGRISMLYDGVSEEKFKVQIKIIGPQCYTLINALPGIILQLILIYEIFAMSTSTALSVIISFSCFVFGLASLVAAGIMSEELTPLPIVAIGMTSGES
ncbi:hypothetical protein BDQ17DRAFT_1414265 [Cyathus striatus]|nr:hypothetical protein BDQ17DRAFT_1414265 [Cyathus striatus]